MTQSLWLTFRVLQIFDGTFQQQMIPQPSNFWLRPSPGVAYCRFDARWVVKYRERVIALRHVPCAGLRYFITARAGLVTLNCNPQAPIAPRHLAKWFCMLTFNATIDLSYGLLQGTPTPSADAGGHAEVVTAGRRHELKYLQLLYMMEIDPGYYLEF